MSGTLNFGLNGLQIDPTQIGFELSATESLSKVYTVSSTGNYNITSFQPTSADANPNERADLSLRKTSSHGFTINLQVKQGTRSIGSGGLYKLAGWNADAILLVERGAMGESAFIVVADAPLKNGTPEDLKFSIGPYVASGAGAGPTIDGVAAIVCFAAGTRIKTAHGEKPVDDLQVGDLVFTASGALQPVIWVGHRSVRCSGHEQPAKALPVTIDAGAFGQGQPTRSLTLSPEHCIFCEGVMVPAGRLVNGATIRQVNVSRVTYYHVELPQHDVLIADGLPTESYLETGSKHTLERLERLAQAA